MQGRALDVGIVTDEVSTDLGESLDLCAEWEVARLELREGSERRFPYFTREEVSRVEDAVRDGSLITAVSPGIFKCAADDEAQIARELNETLPRSLELAARFGCTRLIVFGFQRYAGERPENRASAARTLAEAGRVASDSGMTVAVENEPNFWIDTPLETAVMLEEIGDPSLKANWDPANLVWGGRWPSHEEFAALRRHIVNVHVKDFSPGHAERIWAPVGQGELPWSEYLRWIAGETDLEHVTLETHCLPRVESSQSSLEALREMMKRISEP